jgi:hypothetical protein
MSIPKPAHFKGTILTCQIKGSGQFLEVSPQGLQAGTQTLVVKEGIGHSINCRILIPITEYHLTCDRLTQAQVDTINPPNWNGNMNVLPWKMREGTVNSDVIGTAFLGEPPETLLFETWNMEPTFVPNLDNPCRFRMSCVLRCRSILKLDSTGTIIDASEPHYGWNHDYYVSGSKGGWTPITMKNNIGGDNEDVKRYLPVLFMAMFYAPNNDAGELAMSCGNIYNNIDHGIDPAYYAGGAGWNDNGWA